MIIMSRNKWHYYKTLKLAFPVMIAQVGQVMVSQADNIMVGKLGTIPLAAAVLANSLFIVTLFFGIGSSFALSPLIAAADGSNNKKAISSFLKHGLVAATLLGVFLYGLNTLLAESLPHLGQDRRVAAEAVSYLHWLNASIPVLMVFFCFKQFAEGLSDTKVAMLISIGSNVINIALNYALIYGEWGAPEMGLAGAGLATLIARVLQLLGMFMYITSSTKFSTYWLAIQWNSFEKAVFMKLAKLGIPSGLQMVFEIGAFAFAAMMTGWISPEAQAAHNIAIGLASVSYIIASGLGAAAAVRIGNQMGRKDWVNLRKAANTVFVLTTVIMVSFGIIFLIGRNTLPLIYINEESVVSIAASLLVVATMFQLSDGQQVAVLGALRGMADVKVPTFIVFVAYWVIALPLSYFFGIHLEKGALGVWYGIAAGLTISAALLTWRFYSMTRKK